MVATHSDARIELDRLIRERGEDYASLSRLIGRNAAYVQQFIKRGVPKKLDEGDRAILARYFGIPQSLLGGPADSSLQIRDVSAGSRKNAEILLVPYYNVQASAGAGAVADEERTAAQLAFRSDRLRELSDGNPAALSVIRVSGDSMVPTLADGDDILVDRGDAGDRLRDGIYVLRVDDLINVKRIAMRLVAKRFDVISDNPVYPSWRDCDLDAVMIIGRVIWVGRKLS